MYVYFSVGTEERRWRWRCRVQCYHALTCKGCNCGTHRPLQVKSAGIDDDDVLMWSKLREASEQSEQVSP
ncbi:hypothetical protein VNO80_29109 [Phaseolus coccineus]|uniref:Uncharacterized protein n=1 Tax=Phaseolus coccineus TaxID=3886 RepID=A0AAN9QI68_PHACN